ncbi:MAG TPA: FAD-dependent oxidoreductase [Pyrinomonadaceae bacterium]|mgnify:CR=1 FL=1|nr:FAD-dependent oxidoreductase [Pyrinomonadaceae bacterium]
MNRDENLERVRKHKQPWDIIVIGGGATGVGCALDAASRRLDVLLLEQHDLGKGTSSRSTKLVHGGVRYLAQGDLGLVREALSERSTLLQNAPHVVHIQEFIVPCYSLWQKVFYGVGLKIYDLLAGSKRIGRSKILSRSETTRRFPTVNTEGLSGGILYHDGQFDDARLLIDMARTADGVGACLINYAPVLDFQDDDLGSIVGVKFRDLETGEIHKVLARTIINATGAFCDPIRKNADPKAKPVVTFAQGSHIVLERRFLPSDAALMIPKTSDGRVLFCIPWHDHVIVGTTDISVESAVLEPEALDAEIDFILETVGGYLTERPKRADILSVFAGIRPLVNRSDAKNTAALSRSHELFVDADVVITITGGKWTTYRRMAEDAVDRAVEIGSLDASCCVTANLKISAPPKSSGQRLHKDLQYTDDDVVRAVRDEMARTVEDVLARRTRTLFLNAAAAIEMAPKIAEIMARELGRDSEWVTAEIAAFRKTACRYRSEPSA